MSFQYILVYITTASREEAKKISKALLETELVACTNIIGEMHSAYHWQGQIEENQETILVAKTKLELFTELETKVKELHSYDCPCIIALPIIAGSEGYLEWLQQSCKKSSKV